jgi:hypothetical protein
LICFTSGSGVLDLPTVPRSGYAPNSGDHFKPRLRISAMDRFKEKFSVLPIEVMVVLAINVVVVAFGYYAVTVWGLFIR